jgi:hypothetical protein
MIITSIDGENIAIMEDTKEVTDVGSFFLGLVKFIVPDAIRLGETPIVINAQPDVAPGSTLSTH